MGVFIDSLKYLNKRLRVQLSFRFEIIKRTSSHRLSMCSMEISISFCRDNSYSRWAACSCAFVNGCPIHSDLWLAFPSLILFCVLICFFVMIMANLQNLHLEIDNPRKWSPRECFLLSRGDHFLGLPISRWRFSKPIRIENFGENLHLEIANLRKKLFWLPPMYMYKTTKWTIVNPF